MSEYRVGSKKKGEEGRGKREEERVTLQVVGDIPKGQSPESNNTG